LEIGEADRQKDRQADTTPLLYAYRCGSGLINKVHVNIDTYKANKTVSKQ